MRRLLVGATLVLVAGMTAACGGSPDDASKKDFCEAFTDQPGSDPSQDDLDEYTDKLEETGTPKEIKGDAREGFEVFIDALEDVDVDDEEALEKLDEDVSKDDEKKLEKFFAKAGEVCAESAG